MYFGRKIIRVLMHIMFVFMLIVILNVVWLIATDVNKGDVCCVEAYGILALLIVLIVGRLFAMVESAEARRALEKQKELAGVEKMKQEIIEAIIEQEKIDRGHKNVCNLSEKDEEDKARKNNGTDA